METVVSIIGILLCLKDRKRLRFFLIAFVIMLINSAYMFVLVDGGVLKMLHDMNYDTTGSLFRGLLWAIPLVMNIGFYGFLLLGIARIKTGDRE